MHRGHQQSGLGDPAQGSAHTAVWSAAGGGDMAPMSDGILIVTGKAPD